MSARPGKQTLRVIAGEWRGRKIQFPDNPAIRPTPDRVRETLFNWLMPVLSGARCLDLFCGSGILGLEALSRGAREVVFVDNHQATISTLQHTCHVLGTDKAKLTHADALGYLQDPRYASDVFDIVFLDPPYHAADLLVASASMLQEHLHLSDRAYVYVEHDQAFAVQRLPASWVVHRQKQAGQVCYSLYTV